MMQIQNPILRALQSKRPYATGTVPKHIVARRRAANRAARKARRATRRG